MTKILEIKTCKECPKRVTHDNYWFCSEKPEKEAVNSYEIPSWCPLPDDNPGPVRTLEGRGK